MRVEPKPLELLILLVSQKGHRFQGGKSLRSSGRGMFLLIPITASIQPSGNFVICCGTIQKPLNILRPSRGWDIDSSRILPS